MPTIHEILVVDDDPDMQRLYSQLLTSAGFLTLEALDLATGLALLKKRAPHLVILDLALGKVSGFQLLKESKQDPKLASIPVLVATSSSDRQSVHTAVALGASDYLVKPIERLTLLQKVKKALKDKGFSKKEFPPGDPSAVITLTAKGTIVRGTTSGLLIEAPIKIGISQRIHIRSEFLTTAGLTDDAVFQRTQKPSSSSIEGQSVNDIAVVGIDRDTLTKIRSNKK